MNSYNLNLAGSYAEQREMVHNLRDIKFNPSLGNLLGGFVSILIGISIMSVCLNYSVQSLREEGVIQNG